MANQQKEPQLNEVYIHYRLLTMQKQLLNKHSTQYYQWLRGLITLSAGILTVLVSFHNTYIPPKPTAIWLLQCCWLFLSGAIILGQLSLYGQSQALFEAASRIGNVLQKRKEEKEDAYVVAAMQGVSVVPSILYHYALLIAVVLFSLSLFLLALFAGLNLPATNFPPR